LPAHCSVKLAEQQRCVATLHSL